MLVGNRGQTVPTKTPWTHPKRVGSGGGSFCSSPSSSELSPSSICLAVVSSYRGGLESSCSHQIRSGQTSRRRLQVSLHAALWEGARNVTKTSLRASGKQTKDDSIMFLMQEARVTTGRLSGNVDVHTIPHLRTAVQLEQRWPQGPPSAPHLSVGVEVIAWRGIQGLIAGQNLRDPGR